MSEKGKENLMLFMKLVQENKNVLFGRFGAPDGKQTKSNKDKAWIAIRDECIKDGNKSWIGKTSEYLRDAVYGCNKARTLKRRDKFRKSGEDGGRYTEVDKLILEIEGENSPQVKGLQVSDTGERATEFEKHFFEDEAMSDFFVMGSQTEASANMPSTSTAYALTPSTAIQSFTTALPTSSTAIQSFTTALPTSSTAIQSFTTALPTSSTAIQSFTTALPTSSTAIQSFTTALPTSSTAISAPSMPNTVAISTPFANGSKRKATAKEIDEEMKRAKLANLRLQNELIEHQILGQQIINYGNKLENRAREFNVFNLEIQYRAKRSVLLDELEEVLDQNTPNQQEANP
uniref:Regulatory protein zeste n=1 Tax=Acrobeloides nanus TaxID=290746 RepID=A0A914DHS9_9BILA